ncbi:DUF11 domain-containing protein [Candidatus Uhrbacteria bacterium]|nr:DUF11 domain-containing protein [Candidatus Uhrbacteria bacterium]
MNRHNKRHTARDIKKELRAIYAPRDGKLPDLTRISHRKRSATTQFLIKIILILAVLSVVAWSGFFFLTNGLFDEQETLDVKIETEKNVRSGEETSFTVRYENTGRVPIASLNLKLNLPASFHIASSIPDPTSETQWLIGSLTPGSDGAIIVKGVFLSEVPSVQKIQTLFTYKPANFNSDFQKIENKSIEIKTSAIEMKMTGPEKALAGDSVTYVLNLTNTGKQSVFNLRVLPNLPADFTISSSKPEMKKDEPFWEIATLEPGKLMEISFTGAFTSTASGELSVVTKVGFMDEENFYEQTKTEVKTDVLGGAVSFHLIINGSDKDQTIETGESLRGSIDYKNPGTESVEGVKFTLEIKSEKSIPIDWEKANLSDGKLTGSIVVWDKNVNKEFSKIKPGKEGVIDFTLPIVGSLSSNQSDQFTIALSMNVEKIGSVASTHTIDATPIVVSVNSNVKLTSEARYFSEDGTPFGSGPLPPRVGETTTYRIFWTLNNSLHELENVEVSTILPQDVSWKENSAKDIGTLIFNSTTRQVRWQISKLPIEIKNAQAWFDVSITPKSQDVGKFVKLSNQTTLEAIDSITKTEMNSSLPVLTTELSNDEFANGKGIVSK